MSWKLLLQPSLNGYVFLCFFLGGGGGFCCFLQLGSYPKFCCIIYKSIIILYHVNYAHIKKCAREEAALDAQFDFLHTGFE